MTREEILNSVKYNNLILTAEFLQELQIKYEEQQRLIKERLKAVLEDGTPFGEPDAYEPGGYFPAEVIEVLDSEQGLIRYREPGINMAGENSILHLHIAR